MSNVGTANIGLEKKNCVEMPEALNCLENITIDARSLSGKKVIRNETRRSDSENTNFCPNCGADMREEGDPNENKQR